MAKKSSPSGLEPIGLALILCDHVHIDPITGRRSMLGTFNEIIAESFPTTYPKMAVYAALTDGRGVLPITIRLIDTDEEHPPVWSDIQSVNFDDPHRVEELAVEVRDAEFANSGSYNLQLLCADVTIMERSVLLLETPPSEDA